MISVGIDVSKQKSTICIMKPHGELANNVFEVNHTGKELTDLISQLLSFDEEVKVILEATGHYHLPVVQMIMEAGLFVSVINPLVMKKFASISIRKGKTDRIDATKIAYYGISHWFELRAYEIQDEVYGELRELSRQYLQYMSIKVKCKITQSNLLDRVMPGIKKALAYSGDNPKKNKLNAFVEKYWHYDNIKTMSEKRFINSYQRWTKKEGYHQSETKAKTIYALATGGIPTLDSNHTSTKMLVLESARMLREVEASLNLILAQMQSLAKSLPEYEVVRHMNGVGEKLACRLIAEIGDVRRFHSSKALIAYAGIDAPPHQSGAFYGSKRHISKRGSKSLRKTGYEVMKCLKSIKPSEDNAVYEFILKKEQEGKPKKVAKIAGLNKFLRIYFARVNETYR